MTTLNINTLAAIQLSQVIEQLNSIDDDVLVSTYNEYASSNGYEHISYNDEDTINNNLRSAYDAIQAAQYGEYNANHEYFIFNGSGNLVSFNYPKDDNSPIDIEELSQWIVDNDFYNEYDIKVTTLDDMLASIEDNINDDGYILSKLADYLGQSLHTEQVEQLKTDDNYYEYLVSHFMNELDDYSYGDLYDLINTVGINYSVN